MHETDFSHSHLENAADGATKPAGWQVLRGWVWPKAGGHFVDVRALVGERLFPAVHGEPRADLAAHFHTARPFALAGFHVTLDLPPGRTRVRFEVLDLEGRWREFQAVNLEVASQPTEDGLQPAAEHLLRWHDFTRGLDQLLRRRHGRPDPSWLRLARELVAELPRIHDLMHPPQPFIGHADEPSLAAGAKFGRIPVVGYIFHTSRPLDALWASTDLHALQPLKLGRATENLIPHFPAHPVAAAAGYEGYVDVPPQLPNPISLRLYARCGDDGLRLVQVRRFRRHDAEMDKLPHREAHRGTFTVALHAWRTALAESGRVVVEDTELSAALDRVEAGFLRAPASSSAARCPGRTSPSTTPRHFVLATHNLGLEGAPLFLLDLARYLAAQGIRLTVASAADGPLRAAFAELGAQVVLVDVAPLFRAQGETAAVGALAAIGRAVDFATADAVITNTFTTFWAVHAAHAAAPPTLTYVHESTTPALFYGDTLHPAVLALVESALCLANAVSFTSEATRAIHHPAGRPVRSVVTPGWVDVAKIDQWRREHNRLALRAQLGVQEGEWLVTNVGTVCDRKGQIGFLRAVDLFQRRHPDLAARTRFILLGGRASAFDDALRAVLTDLQLERVEIHAESADYLGYYAAADLTVCSSWEESSPRVVLEAMACGTPLLASDIPGIRELARPDEEALLVSPGHTPAWANALAALLNSPEMMQRQARAARARIEAEFSAERVLPRHLALARAVIAGQSTAP